MTNINLKSTSLITTFIALGLIIFGVRLQIIDIFGSYMPYWDGWGMGGLLYDHISRGLSFHDITVDANEHRQVFGRLLAVALFELNHRQWDPIVMMIANSITWTITGLLLIFIAIRHSHETNPIAIIAIILVLWTYPVSLVNALWGVQSHIYFMTLFAVLGSWYVAYPLFSKQWCVGAFSLFAGGLTLAGGSFVAVSVATVYLIYAWVDNQHRHHHLWTGITAVLAATFGITLILIQDGGGNNLANLNLLNWFLTFSKTMSWPVRTHVWPFFLFLIPILVIFKHFLNNNINQSKLVPFLLSIYGFIIIIAIAVATARSSEGSGPARRYADFLTLAFIASSFALLFIQQKQFKLPKVANQLLVVAWLMTIVIAVPYRLEVLQYTLDDRAYILPFQEKNVRQFINSNDQDWLQGKNFRHIPFPRPGTLARSLVKFQQANILPYQLQRPPLLVNSLDESEQTAFIHHGLFFASTGQHQGNLFGETVIGSYNVAMQGNKATGKFVSNVFNLNRNYAMIPIIGYTGFPNLSLKLVNVDTKDEIIIKPAVRSSLYAETWREVLVRAPQGNYQLIAHDSNEELWFGFAAPRSVGRLSYWAQRYKDKGQLLWFFGLCLLLFTYRKQLVKSISAQ